MAQAALATGTRHTILLVEDDGDIRDAIAMLLSEEGYDVRTAVNGRDALAKLEAGLRPDVVLLDLMMPVMNGWEFLEAVSADPRQRSLPVVIVSAVADGYPGGSPVRRVVRKPIDMDDLLSAVEAAGAAPT